MKWKKTGLIFDPQREYHGAWTHAAVPIVKRIGDELYRIYFSSRDDQNRAHTMFLEVQLDEPRRIRKVAARPVLSPGNPGTFDDAGAMGAWIVTRADKTYLYYTGWNRGGSVPFRNAIGLAVSHDRGVTFEKYSKGPILDRGVHDPCFVATPCVIVEGHHWRMWYLSCIDWDATSEPAKHYYHIKYAESSNGIDWDRHGIVCVDFKSDEEYAISTPCVIKDKDIYRMWYSYRGKRYRIGYAESKDGLNWERRDHEVGIDVSDVGWDSEMIEYPFVFDHKGQRYMVYNGNSYGKTGFGLAVLTS